MALDNKSKYYDAGGIELINIIQAKLTTEQFEGWLLGNILKYAGRANFKNSFERDIEKIGVYQKKLDEVVNGKQQMVENFKPFTHVCGATVSGKLGDFCPACGEEMNVGV